MTAIIRKCTVTLSRLASNRFNALPTFFFFSSSSLELSSTISHHLTDSILSFLNQTGFSSLQIDHMIKKYPQTLKISPEILKAKLKIFLDNGFSTSDTVDINSKQPWILNRCSEDRIKTSIAALKFVLGSTEAVCRVLKKLSWFLSINLDKNVIPNFEYLINRSGLSCSCVANFMIKYPMVFLLHPESLVEGTRRVDEMGLEWTPKLYLHAVNVVCSLSPATLQLKKNIFLGLGFSDRKVLMMFNRRPGVFSLSERKIKENIEVLLSSGRTDLSSLAVRHTKLLLYSVEKRIKPRLNVIEALEERGLLPRKLGLSTILNMTNEKFLEYMVLSNSDALANNIQKQVRKVSSKSMKAKLMIFHKHGFSTLDTIDIISKHPWILRQCSENRIKTSIAALKFVLGSTEAVCRILKKLSWFLKKDLDKTMIPNIKYLTKSCNLSPSEVTDHLIRNPMIFLLRPETVAKGTRRVDEMGLEWSPKMYLYAVSIVCSLSPTTFELKNNIFLGLGFSDSDVLRIFNRCPFVFSSSEKKIKENVEVLLSSGRTNLSSLAVRDTNLLLFSTEKRIKPRLKIIEALEERGLLPRDLGLSTIVTMTNKTFLDRLVFSNSDAFGSDFVNILGRKSQAVVYLEQFDEKYFLGQMNEETNSTSVILVVFF